MIAVIQAIDAAGHRHELHGLPDEPTARRRAVRAAALLGSYGARGRWAGGKVVCVDATDGRLMLAARIVVRKGPELTTDIGDEKSRRFLA